MIRLISLLFVTILLTSCKESRVDKITRLVNEWSGKTIRFPDNMCLTSYANDTVIMKYEREKLPYTILNYVDTKGKRKFIKHLRDNHFDRFVFIDEMDSLNRMNNFLHEEHLCTFLLDKNDKIIAIGNPILNYNVKKMYLDIISGKTVLSSYDKQLLTDVSISKTKIDLGTFSWNDAQEVEIQISNVGKNTLVMNDVITSCGCISVEYSKEPIQSNKVLSMKIKYKAEHPEHFDKTITIYCNIKDAPLRLKISGNAE